MSKEWSGGVGALCCANRRALVSIALLGSSACATAPKPATSPAAPATAARAATAQANDVSTVPAPPGLVAVGRVRDYREWLRLERTPALFDFLRSRLESEEPLAHEWDPAQAIEFAVVFDRNFQRSAEAPIPKSGEEPEGEAPQESEEDPSAAVSAPSEPDPSEHLLAALSIPLTRYAPETYEKLGFKHWSANAYERAGCLIAPALGAAKARLVCSDHRDVTRQLYGYMTRGLPLQPLSSAPIFAEFRPQQLKPLWETSRESIATVLHSFSSGDDRPSLRAVSEIALNLLDEADAWVASLESLRLEAGPSTTGEFRSTLRFTLRDPAPWLIQGYQATAARITGAPAEFRALPADIGAAGYGYHLPAERLLVMQNALVNLAKTALKEYGPLRPEPGDQKLTAEQARAVDRVTSDLIAALDSPCLRADHVVWANSAAEPSVAKTRALPLNAMLQANFGYYFAATPGSANCAGLGQSLIDTVELARRNLPRKLRRDIPFSTSLRRQSLPDLGPATVYRVTFSARSINSWLELDGKNPKKMPGADRALPAKAPVTLSVIVLPGANGGASDWLALGLDEKALITALGRAVHPNPGRTLGDSPELAPFLAKRPLTLSYRELRAPDEWLRGVLGKESEVLEPIFALFRGTRITATTELVHAGNYSELSTNYHVSKEVLIAIGTLLGWDWERYGTILEELEKH